MSGGNSLHGTVIGRLMVALGAFIHTQRLGELVTNANFNFELERAWSPVPDIAFISSERFARIFRESAPFDGAPDLAIEVTSPSNSDDEIARKTDAYLRAGASRVWVVRPDMGTVTVTRPDWTARTLHIGESVTSDDAGFDAAGFDLSLQALFAR